MNKISRCFLLLLVSLATAGASTNESQQAKLALPGFDAELTTYAYPFAVQAFALEAQQQKLHMAFMHLKPGKPNGSAIVLLHGKNFGGYAFEGVAKRLSSAGYRVVMPDQIGFGKSSKPAHFQYTFQALAAMTSQLLEGQGVNSYILLGHSMGGMLTRMALMYPDKISKLVLVNPIGLEDWKLLTPYKSVDGVYQDELKSTPESIRKYQTESYYSGTWKPEYEKLIEASAGWTKHPQFPLIAWNSALTFDMAFTQPVLYEFKNLKVPTVLVIGQNDRTALGRAWAPEENQKRMGQYPELCQKVASEIPKAKLIKLEGLGHVPFVENEDRFFDEGIVPALVR